VSEFVTKLSGPIVERLLNSIEGDNLIVDLINKKIFEKSQKFTQKDIAKIFGTTDGEALKKTIKSDYIWKTSGKYLIVGTLLKDSAEKPFAIIFSKVDISKFVTSFVTTISLVSAMMIGLVIFATLFATKVGVNLTKHVNNIAQQVQHISDNNDYTKLIKTEYSGEIGIIATKISNLVETIRTNSVSIYTNMKESKAKLDELKEHYSSFDELLIEFLDNFKAWSERTQQVSAAVHQIDESITGIYNGTNEVTEKSKKLREIADKTLEVTLKTHEFLQMLINEITTVNKVSETANNISKNLYEESSDIDSILNAMDDISKRINLLSLNAAIEAARASEAGKGFAVVADEIRKLVFTTQEFSKKIKNKVKNIKNGIAEITESIDSVKDNVKKLMDQSITLSEDFEKVENSMRETHSIVNEVTSLTLTQASLLEVIKNTSDIISTMSSELAEDSVESNAQASNVKDETMNIANNIDDVILKIQSVVSIFNEKVKIFKEEELSQEHELITTEVESDV